MTTVNPIGPIDGSSRVEATKPASSVATPELADKFASLMTRADSQPEPAAGLRAIEKAVTAQHDRMQSFEQDAADLISSASGMSPNEYHAHAADLQRRAALESAQFALAQGVVQSSKSSLQELLKNQ